ncbi:capsule assembly Wzi family protein [Fodinibius sp. SL11]|uniref:capsule assembly Wzi family protein n=1 Tax=Fodinibius sp. SL11 TaxID=3425690 RepID=UPI003F88553D
MYSADNSYSINSILKLISGLVMLFILTVSSHTTSKAQHIPENDIYKEYLKALELNGSLSNSNSLGQLDSLKQHPWQGLESSLSANNKNSPWEITPHDPQLRSYWQSLEPGGWHDGPVWQGRGFTTDFSAGLYLRYGVLSASVRPRLIYNQNRNFVLSPYATRSNRSEFAYPLGNIDWPQQFGNDPFWTLDPGESYIRADYGGWATGISNEQMRWGPSRQNALLMDSNAPGFRHFFIGTSEPKDIYIGNLEAKMLWGKLIESDYFDNNTENNERYISGLNLSFTPKPTPGLTLGINRIFYETIPPEGIPFGDLFKIFEAFTKVNFTSNTNTGGNDQADQLISLFGKWTFPQSGLEIYGEWARTDHSWNWRDFFTEPEHSRGYTIGLQKTFDLSNTEILSVNAELTQLEASKTGAIRGSGFPSFYVHHRSQQGYTNRGQLLGASIGPSSNSQYLGSSLYFDKGRITIFTQRVTQNNDFLYNSDAMFAEEIQNPNNNKYWLHNVEMRFGASLLYHYKQFETEIGFTYRRELNDDYIYKNDKNHLGIEMSIRYRISDLR